MIKTQKRISESFRTGGKKIMRKKILSGLLSICMLLSLVPVTAMAVDYNDTDGHWAEAAIDRFSDYGVLQGDNGNFNPNKDLTRAEMATMITRLMQLPAAQSAGFTDVPAGAWYADAINRCAAAGIMLGYNGKANPNASISRQDAMVMLGRALGIQPEANPDLSGYDDAASVSNYAKGYVAALVNAGIVNGVSEGQLAPGSDITRAATVTILDRAISAYANKDGATVTGTGSGIVLVVADDVTITGDVADVVVAQGADGNTVTLDDATATGTITVNADANLVLAGSTKAKAVVANQGAKAAVTVEKGAKADSVTLSGAGSSLNVSGTVGSVTVSDTADKSTVTTASTGTIDAVNSAADNVTVSGSGKVTSATITGDNNNVTTSGTKVDVANDADGTTVSGKDVAAGGSTTSTGTGTTSTTSTGTGTTSSTSGGSSSGSSGKNPNTTTTKCTVTIDYGYKDGESETNKTDTQEVDNGGKVDTSIITREGYTLEGLYTDSELQSKFDAANTTITEAITLYAKWTENEETPNVTQYTVTFDSNNGSEATSQKVDSGVAVAQPADPTRAGDTFLGWYTDDGAKYNFETTVIGDITLTAKWTVLHAHVWNDSVCTQCGEKQEAATKFFFSVSSVPTTLSSDPAAYTGTDATAVTATVYDDYSLVIKLPGNDAKVNAGNVRIQATMKNVASLGVTSEKNYDSGVVSTGIDKEADLVLSNYLKNSYAFEDATITAKIDGKECTYTFAGNDSTITGTPSDIAATRAAWQALTANVSTKTDKDNDSYIVIANGSTLQIGTEKISFASTYVDESSNKKDLKLDDFSKLDAMKQEILDAVEFGTGKTLGDGIVVKASLKTGTALAVGCSEATLTKDATIYVSGLDLTTQFGSEDATLATLLSTLKADANKDQGATYSLVLDLINAFDAVVGAVDSSAGVTVEVEF
jgi:uncharacterized repeat protein (TIGR02543 family)